MTNEPLKMGCTEILRGVMRRGVWRNNLLMLARLAPSHFVRCRLLTPLCLDRDVNVDRPTT